MRWSGRRTWAQHSRSRFGLAVGGKVILIVYFNGFQRLCDSGDSDYVILHTKYTGWCENSYMTLPPSASLAERRAVAAVRGGSVPDHVLAGGRPRGRRLVREDPRELPLEREGPGGVGRGGQHDAAVAGPRPEPTVVDHLCGPHPVHAVVIAQHMPPRFTRTFAERLDRTGVVHVAEAKQYERLARGYAYVCPGGQCVEIVPSDRGPALRVVAPNPRHHYIPSVDQLFRSAARVLGDKAIAVVLTGMGDDGAAGVVEISKRGGPVLIEEPETAVVAGMPLAVRRSGVEHQAFGIWGLGDRLAELTRPEEG